MKDDMRYTPSDCFENFPLPPGYDSAPALQAAGEAYLTHRAAMMIATDKGMTKTYNRFHDPHDRTGDILELRRLHAAMDDAVLRAYGWDDLAERAILLSRYSDDVIVFTGGTGQISDSDAKALTALGIRIDTRPLADVAGDRTGLTGIVLADGKTVPRTFAFVRPGWDAKLQFAAGLGLELDPSGLIVIDGSGRTSVAGVYAAGESSTPGAQQLIIAAGEGARVAARINRDLLGLAHLS